VNESVRLRDLRPFIDLMRGVKSEPCEYYYHVMHGGEEIDSFAESILGISVSANLRVCSVLQNPKAVYIVAEVDAQDTSDVYGGYVYEIFVDDSLYNIRDVENEMDHTSEIWKITIPKKKGERTQRISGNLIFYREEKPFSSFVEEVVIIFTCFAENTCTSPESKGIRYLINQKMASALAKLVASKLLRIRSVSSSSRFYNTKAFQAPGWGRVNKTKEFLSSKFDMKDMREAEVILGIRIKRENNDPTVMFRHNKGTPMSQLEYSRAIGCLMYAMISTRPYITFAIRKLSSGYPSVIEGYFGASWINNMEDHSSTSESSKYFNLKVFTRLSDFSDHKFTTKIEVSVIITNGESVKDMTRKSDKLAKFEGPVWSEDETLETTRKRIKWEKDDYICRGHILNDMSDSLFDIYQNAESAKALWESLESKYKAEDASAKKFLDDEVAWWVDSGATSHVCRDLHWFQVYKSIEDG
nr:hypothetical protein [Tanacetum cinerariifolium]